MGEKLIRELEALVPLRRRVAAATSRRCPAALTGASDLGTLAFIRDRKLVVLDVASCRERTLAEAGPILGPVSWSGDGRFVAFGPRVVAGGGGRVQQPLPHSGGTLVWAPRGHRLAGVTAKGGVLVGGPGVRARRLLADGWGASTLAWSPSGALLAVSRSLYGKAPPPYHQEIWLLDPRTGGKRELFQLPKPKLAPPLLYGFSPDGRWLVAWEDTQNSASLAADGLPLVAISVADGKTVQIGDARGTLVYRDFLSWCGNALAYVVNRGGRQVSLGDRVAFAAPPTWKPTVTPGRLRDSNSYVSPACSPPGLFELAAAVGPTTQDTPFGQERRRIWLLGYTGGNWHALGPTPPAGLSDELPMWSADGRWLAFIRSGPTNKDAGAHGVLYLLDLGKQFNGQARLVGPLADLGSTGNYYGHYGWSYQLAWRTVR
jgi:dipeptidyl aminopeptidase/acylaminoacyl peptidase